MIDLNEVWRPPVRYDLDEIRERLCATAAEWLPQLFPHARMSADGKTLRCADLSGRAPRNEGSCVIHLRGPRAGWGYDHATGECAGPIDMVHHGTGLTPPALFDEAARYARLDRPTSPRPAQATPDHSHEVARILAGCAPLAGTLAERYLQARGLRDPASPDLLFNPDLADFETRRGWPGMVARVRDGAGEPTGGIHRTFLLDDGSGKAPAGKKMLGPVAGGSVRLFAIGDDGHLGIAEGIETALAAHAIFGIPTWAALSADGLRKWEWPADIKRVIIFADAGAAGQHAAAALAERLNFAGIANMIVSPLHGDDFNDDLRRGAPVSDYPVAAPQSAPPLTTAADFQSAARALTKPPELHALGVILGQIVTARLEPLPERQVLSSIKAATGIPVAVLEKQIGELRRRLNTTGDIHRQPTRPRWAGQLRLDLAGAPERNEANVITALCNDEAFAGVIVFDEFRQEILVVQALPWEQRGQLPRSWSDVDDVRCAEWLQRREINVSPSIVSRGINAVARESCVHPVRNYLMSLVWDGVQRLDQWLITYLSAEDTPLNHAIGSRWMISAVARIMQPGAKVDHMLILEGPQGAKKSSALKTLAGAEWFTDELAEVGSKDAAQQMRGMWVIELAELDAISRAEVSRIKAFLTRTTDRYRPPYERYVVEVPRQCVFAGSVNPDTYLRDETGNRRFWPVRCGSIDLDALACDRDQLWAEAVARYREGAIWWLDEPELVASAKAEQDHRYHADAWDARIDRWLVYERRRVNHGYGNYDDWRDEEAERPSPLIDTTVGEILQGALGIEPARWTRADQMRVTAYLKARGWDRYQIRKGQFREWRYRKGQKAT
ncbi:MAG: virulence-associated E family protein [Pseudolabrys sp.]|jgi:predicted P-loop ATPase|nr:virulence-associated E family protein [Pseudolabrys sp.]